MPTSTVKVSNLSLKATKRDIQEFFSFSGEIRHIEMQSEGDHSQVAFVTFKDSETLNTVLLLSGATIVDQSVNITAVENFNPTYEAADPDGNALSRVNPILGPINAATKAQDVVVSMLAKGYILGKDMLHKGKAFDEKHQLTAQMVFGISNLDKKMGLSEKLMAGTSAANETLKSVDQKYHVSEKTKLAFSAAEQKASSYAFTGANWVTDTFDKIAKAAGEIGQKTKEKLLQSSTQPRDDEATALSLSSAANLDRYSGPPSYDSLFGGGNIPTDANQSQENSKPPPAQGLIL